MTGYSMVGTKVISHTVFTPIKYPPSRGGNNFQKGGGDILVLYYELFLCDSGVFFHNA